MTISTQNPSPILRIITRSKLLTVLLICAFVVTVSHTAEAQTFRIIHYFTGADGYGPAGLTIDQAGNLYGTTLFGGPHNAGVAFKMTKRGSAWTLMPLHNFGSTQNDGINPPGVVIGPDGKLYGTTERGGQSGYGTVYSLAPAASVCGSALCPWIQTELYSFAGRPNDGEYPANADLVFDQLGNIYGTTGGGGPGNCPLGCGTVYELSKNNGKWILSVLFFFQGSEFSDHAPAGGVVFDQAGNLYGTTQAGGAGLFGTVYELTPEGSNWFENTIFDFDGGNTGGDPVASLLVDASGNLFGTTSAEGPNNPGTVFELTPSNSGWNFNLLSSFNTQPGGEGPVAPLNQDAAGNLYGTTATWGAFGYGNVFKLTRTNNGWTFTSLHDFGFSDGAEPQSRVVMDAQGNLYGTASAGGLQNPACSGDFGCGIVWMITR